MALKLMCAPRAFGNYLTASQPSGEFQPRGRQLPPFDIAREDELYSTQLSPFLRKFLFM
jgi:hypothetical protein